MSAAPTTTPRSSTATSSALPAFRSLSVAIARGFWRDRASVFFAVIFPLMFLVLFGGIFGNQQQPRIDLLQVGGVPVFDQIDGQAAEAFEEAFEVTRTDDLAAAVAEVRAGDADVAVEMQGDRLVAHFTQTDQARAGVTLGTLRSFVDGANVAASGAPPRWSLQVEPVEDESLQAIQYVTPGLLGWAIAMSAAFGAAATLNGWRNSRLLRRLQLSPVPTGVLVAARVAVTVAVALGQMAIFLGVGTAFFGLELTGSWPAAVPLLVVGTLCFMAIGLLAGAVAKTTEGAVNMANFLVLPMAFLSGSFFPLEGAPDWLQGISRLLPLRWLNEGMLDVMVRGEPAAAVLLPVGILAAFAVVVTALAAKLFRWEVV